MVRPLVVLAVCSIAFLAAFSFAEPEENDMKGMNPTQLAEVYDKIEMELLRRFSEQKKEKPQGLSDTIKALGHIRSKKAIPLLLQNIDITPNVRNEKIGDFYPVKIVGATTYSDVYVALGALERIGAVSLDRCVAELETAETGSKREMLLAKLAHACHGKAFVDRARLLKKSDNEKWERVLKLSGEK